MLTKPTIKDSAQHHLDVSAVTFTRDEPNRTSMAAFQVKAEIEVAERPR